MIKEAYVSFEVAKLLKEKGFDEECIGAYSETNHTITKFEPNVKNSEVGPLMYSAPTHQMAMKWLREVHKVFFCIHPDYPISKDYMVEFYNESRPSECFGNYPTYEQACEVTLKYCLENLI